MLTNFHGDIHHACGVTRKLRNRMFRGGQESAAFAGLNWMDERIDPD
jgi:hypothetical protein